MKRKLEFKVTAVIMTLVMIVVACGNFFNVVFANDNAIIQLNNMSEVDAGFAVYKDQQGGVIGRIIGQYSEGGFTDNSDVGEMTTSHGLNKFEWQGLNAGTYRFKIEVSEGYAANVFAGGSLLALTPVEGETGVYTFDITVAAGSVVIVDPGFNPTNPGGPGGPEGPEPPPFVNYEIIAKFEGVEGEVISDFGSNILLPEGWTEGEVEFYARTCTVGGEMQPYNDGMQCDEDSYAELRLDIEGMINRDEINNSVGVAGERGDETNESTQVAVITEDFLNYGRAGFHLCRYNSPINQALNIVTEDMIFVRAEATLGMTYSFGSATIDNALLTTTQEGDVSIFFGNTETTLRVEGIMTTGITNVLGGENTVINYDGTATVTLPPLSKETTTTLTLTIGLQGGNSVTRTLNVRRTAIELGFNRAEGNATLNAGYVAHKAYLYNNQAHNDEVFDAYLQVILYKDGVVAGYRQIQIDDEDFINGLGENDSGSMELYSNDCIKLYGTDLGDTIEGVNSASVFLTNGPIDYNSDTLPSVEFGIGSGVTIEFGGEE